MAFDKPYAFKVDKKEVVIQHKAGGDFSKFLRVKPGSLGDADSQGGKGEFARWIVEFDGNGSRVRLKSKKSGKYLRIMADGKINVEGGTGPLTLFKVHTQGSANLVKLESNKFDGKYISVKKNGDVNVGNGGPWTELKFFRDGGAGGAGGAFNKPYVFKVSGKEVVIQHKAGGDFDKFLRVKPNDEGKPDSQGGKGAFARWIVELDGDKARFKSKKSGKYLRIMANDEINVEGGTGALTLFKVHGNGNQRKLESNKFGGKYISVKKNGDVNVGSGGPWTELKFFRDE